MKEPDRTQWQIRCAFNGFCKRTLRNEAANARRDRGTKIKHETCFSDLSPQEAAQLYFYDDYEENEADKSFFVEGREITAKQLADAIQRLPEEKKTAVLLYYFKDMSDREIGNIFGVPRSTVQYRRASFMELLKQYLEGGVYEDENGR